MNSITRQNAAKLAAEFFAPAVPGHRLPQRLLHLVGLGCEGREWKFQAGQQHPRTGR